MDFAITAYDHTDDQAHTRRLASREAHLEGVRGMLRDGSFLSGGGIVDGSGKMIGSSMHMRFPSREDLQSWLDREPYVRGNVWNHIGIREVILFRAD